MTERLPCATCRKRKDLAAELKAANSIIKKRDRTLAYRQSEIADLKGSLKSVRLALRQHRQMVERFKTALDNVNNERRDLKKRLVRIRNATKWKETK